MPDKKIVCAMAVRTLRQAIESPIAYVVAIFFYGFVGGILALNYFNVNQGDITTLTQLAPWILWFVIPALTMGLLADEFRSGTFEQLATLPVRDAEIVIGKFLGFASLAFLLIGGLSFFIFIVGITVQPGLGIDWGGSIGVLAALFLTSLSYGAMGLFASSLTKNQVVALILGMIFCTAFFMAGQISGVLPGILGQFMDYAGILSHMDVLARGVWDFGDLFYFGSVIFLFLFLTVQRLSTRRF